MIQEHWIAVKEKLQAALDLEPAKRRAYLDEAAGSNPNCAANWSHFLLLMKVLARIF